MKPILELRGLSKSFGGLHVIRDLDLEVGEGEILSVIGPNGAGKTTLFNLVTAIYPPDTGDILLDGQSILGLKTDAIAGLVRRRIDDFALVKMDGLLGVLAAEVQEPGLSGAVDHAEKIG